MLTLKRNSSGFTIVELLIVVVVIAILAAISVVAYTGIQDRARRSKVDSDIRNILTAVHAARHTTGKTLTEITGTGYTANACVIKPAGTDLSTLPNSDGCISRYKTTLDAISTASGLILGDIRDPWGRPYKIDENEGESGGCQKDTLAMYALPHNSATEHPWIPRNNVPLSGFSGCL